MKPILTLACAGVCFLSLTACNTTTGAHVLDNLSNDCTRDYDGTVNAGLVGSGFSGTVKIHCNPERVVPANSSPPAP